MATSIHGTGRRRRLGTFGVNPAVLGVLCGLCSGIPVAAHAAPQRAEMADRAADMVGVNTHISFYGTVYDTQFNTIIRPRLLELGVRHIRDSPSIASEPIVKQRFIDLAQNGVRTLMINWPVAGLGHDYVKALNAQAGLRVVEAVEPPNERDVSWYYYDFGSAWQQKLADWMVQNYPLYKNDPATAGITVLGPSFANTRDSAVALAGSFPAARSYMDAGNLHNYSGVHPESPIAGGWGISLSSSLERYRALSGSKPLWVTENGYRLSGYVECHPFVTHARAGQVPAAPVSHPSSERCGALLHLRADQRGGRGLRYPQQRRHTAARIFGG